MMVDPAIVSTSMAVMGGVVAIVVSVGVYVLLRISPRQFRVARKPVVYYAGWIIACVIAVASVWMLRSWTLSIGLVVATALILRAGRMDEIKKKSALWQLIVQAGIAGVVVIAGWTIPHITNIFHAGVWELGALVGGALAFVWVIACMNAINFLDGTDGLAPAVGSVAFLALAGISLLPVTQDSVTFGLSIIGFSAMISFFFWNAPPAKIYLGTTGSWFLGLYIALTAMIGGGKIVTTLIVLAIPILDALFVIAHRIYMKKSPWHGDAVSHLHHRLARAGVSKWNIVILVSIITSILGYISVAMPTRFKILAFIIVALLFFGTSSRMMKKRIL